MKKYKPGKVIVTKNEIAAAKAVEFAKTLTNSMPVTSVVQNRRKRTTDQKVGKFTMKARLILLGADHLPEMDFLARITGRVTTVPEIPEIVTCEKHVYTLTGTFPLTYSSVLASRATRI